MEIIGYFRNEGSQVYHIVYEVTPKGKTPEGFSPSWTLCGLKPRDRKGEEDILVEAPSCEVVHLCMNCQAVHDSGMVRIHAFETFLNRTPTRKTHPECYPPKEES